jgi:hypothetical protein
MPAAFLAELALPQEQSGYLYLAVPFAVGILTGIFSKSE